MRKESTTIQKCNSRLTALGLNSDAAFHRSRLILKIYRDVVWVLSERAEELQETAWIMGEQDIESGLCYLENFAPDIELQAFEEKVCCLVQNQMLVNIIDRALLRLKRYPDRGELYYEILTKQFIYRFNSTEKELLEELNIERSVFYDRKREAKFFIHGQGTAFVTADQFALLCLVRVLGVIRAAFQAGRNGFPLVFVQCN